MGIEAIFKKSRGDSSSAHYFKEILVTSTNLIHVFSRLHSNPDIVMTAICQEGANLGLVLMKVREIAKSETI